MVEKIITLENIPLTEFLGVENKNINEIASAFPKSKIISRGNEIRIQGSSPEIIMINEILTSLINHYNKYGKLTEENIASYIKMDKDDVLEGHDEVLLYGTRGFKICPKGTNQKKLVESSIKNDLVFAIGPAGTGKTYISVALAVKALKEREVKKIIITRPAVEAGENLGFLPGDLKEKIDPYLRPIYDALDDMIPSEKLKYYKEKGVIEIAPLAYMRGRTLKEAFILLDEAQNTTPMQVKMFLTRMGPKSKMIITGDTTQIDLPNRQKSGLLETLEVLKDVEGIGFIRLSGKDVIRHKLVRHIISAYEKFENK
ncbi:PhoH family protein [Reichenbachiella sp. MALMAid0571]|uniref:PhoH family protein n=1 Tax=Reichenbachiella sp. MALMAid0571 TaxID=3143939 RepID=UPI0032DEB7A6